MIVRAGTPSDAPALATFAARTFRETFGPDNNPEDLALHLQRAYGVSQQTAELSNPSITTLLVEVQGKLAGFAQLKDGVAPPCVTGAAPLEILRFYVDRPFHGHGVAARMMNQVIATARERGARTLWLSVWTRNPRAQGFYSKSGFTVAGEGIFMVGTDPQVDHIMVKPLSAGRRTRAMSSPEPSDSR